MEGQRVRLIRCTDPWAQRPYGLMGVVEFVDDTGTVHVNWDDGTKLGLVLGHDQWEVIDG